MKLRFSIKTQDMFDIHEQYEGDESEDGYPDYYQYTLDEWGTAVFVLGEMNEYDGSATLYLNGNPEVGVNCFDRSCLRPYKGLDVTVRFYGK